MRGKVFLASCALALMAHPTASAEQARQTVDSTTVAYCSLRALAEQRNEQIPANQPRLSEKLLNVAAVAALLNLLPNEVFVTFMQRGPPDTIDCSVVTQRLALEQSRLLRYAE